MKIKNFILYTVIWILACCCISAHYNNVIKNNNEESTRIIEMATKNIDNLLIENESMASIINELKQTEHNIKYLGKFKITHYCNEPYEHICGYGKRTTASGVKTDVGTTIAVDTSVIPFGTKVYVDGIGWREAQDRGGAIKNNKIDVLVDTHDEANALGTFYKDVWILVSND